MERNKKLIREILEYVEKNGNLAEPIKIDEKFDMNQFSIQNLDVIAYFYCVN